MTATFIPYIGNTQPFILTSLTLAHPSLNFSMPISYILYHALPFLATSFLCFVKLIPSFATPIPYFATLISHFATPISYICHFHPFIAADSQFWNSLLLLGYTNPILWTHPFSHFATHITYFVAAYTYFCHTHPLPCHTKSLPCLHIPCSATLIPHFLISIPSLQRSSSVTATLKYFATLILQLCHTSTLCVLGPLLLQHTTFCTPDYRGIFCICSNNKVNWSFRRVTTTTTTTSNFFAI